MSDELLNRKKINLSTDTTLNKISYHYINRLALVFSFSVAITMIIMTVIFSIFSEYATPAAFITGFVSTVSVISIILTLKTKNKSYIGSLIIIITIQFLWVLNIFIMYSEPAIDSIIWTSTAMFIALIPPSGFLINKYTPFVFSATSLTTITIAEILTEKSSNYFLFQFPFLISSFLIVSVYTYYLIHIQNKTLSTVEDYNNYLKENEERYRILFNSGSTAKLVYHLDENNKAGNFIEVNGNAIELLGYSKEELLNMSPSDLSKRYAESKNVSKYIDYLKNTGDATYEIQVKKKSGKKIFVEINTHYFFLNEKETIIASLKDITESKKIKEELIKSQEQLRALFDNTKDFLFVLDSKANILEVNPSISENLGYSKNELLSMKLYKLHPRNRENEIRNILDGLLKGKSALCSIPLITKFNRVLHVETSITKLKWGDDDIYFAISRDITERIKNEKLVRIHRDLGIELSNSFTVHEASECVINAITQLEEIDSGCVFLVSDDGQSLDMTSVKGFDRNSTSYILMFKKLLKKYELQNAEIPIKESFYSNLSKEEEHILDEKSIKAYAIIPVVSGNEVIGLFNFASYKYNSFPKPLKDEIESIISHLGSVIAHLKSKDALRENEEKYRRLFETSTDAIFIESPNGTIMDCNQSACEMYGYSKKDMLKLKVFDLSPKEVGEPLKYSLKEEIDDGGVSKESYGITKSGVIFPIEVNTKTVKINFKKVLIAYVRDISERKKAEEKIKESEEKYRTLVENSNDAIMLWQDDKIQFYNKKVLDLWSYTDEELQTKRIEDLVAPEDRERIYRQYNLMKNGKYSTETYEIRILTKSGKRIWVGISAVNSLWQNGNATLAFIRDITHQKEFEKNLIRAKEEAEESSRLKVQFLANITHELRTPLNSIMGFSQLLSLKKTLDDQTRVELSKRILRSSKILLNLISDVLNLSSIEYGNPSVEKKKTKLSKIIDEAGNVIIESIKLRNKDIKYKVNANNEKLPEYIYTDRQRLLQILINLLSNAVKFTDKGFVTLSIYTKKHNDRNILHFEISDTGIGIPKDRVHLLFEAFTQVDGSITRKYGGTGLGLSIAKNLAELLGGNMWVESEINKGSTFYFDIDISENPDYKDDTKDIDIEQKKNIPKIKKKTNNINILSIIEDEDTAYIINETLSSEYNLIFTKNGYEGLEKINEIAVDLIIIDMELPVLDGIEIIKIIRNKSHLDYIPIIGVRTKEDKYIKRDEFKKEGGNYLLDKPLDIHKLLYYIKKIIE